MQDSYLVSLYSLVILFNLKEMNSSKKIVPEEDRYSIIPSGGACFISFIE